MQKTLFRYHFCRMGCVIIFGISGLLSAVETPAIPKQVLDWEKSAQDSMDKGNTSKAVDYCEKIIQSNPDTAYALDAQKRIVTAYLQGNQADQATAALTEMKQKYASRPEYARVMSQAAYEYRRSGFYLRALELYNEVLSLNPAQEIQLNCRAGIVQAYLGQGDTANALQAVEQLKNDIRSYKGNVRIEDMEEMVRLTDTGEAAIANEVCGYLYERFPDDPWTVWTLQRKARSEVWSKGVDSADSTVNILKQHYASHPEYPSVMGWIAYEYRRGGSYSRAMELYKEALSLKPAPEVQLNCWAGIAQVYLMQGDTTEALRAVEQVKSNLKSCPNFQMEEVEQMISNLADANQTAVAESVCDVLLERFSEDPRMLWIIQRKVRSQVWMKQPDLADATLKIMQQKYAGHPYYADALSWTAEEYWKAGFYPRAQELFKEVLNLTQAEFIQLRCRTSMARMYVRLGKDTKVQEEMDYMLSHFTRVPEDLACHIFGVGEEYYEIGTKSQREGGTPSSEDISKLSKAITVWNTIAGFSSSPKYDAKVTYYSAMACEQMGDYPQAIKYYLLVVEKWPDYPMAWNALFTTLRCSAKLNEKGLLTDQEMEDRQKMVYTALAGKYRDCPMAKTAQRWLTEYRYRNEMKKVQGQ